MKLSQFLNENNGFKYITYGLDAQDLKRRESQKDFRPVGMNNIIDTNNSKISNLAYDRASANKKYIAIAVYRMNDDKEVAFKQLKESIVTESKDFFPDVDVIKLDPDRADSYDVVSALMPTLVRMAYVYLSEDKGKYERTHTDEEDDPFDFSENALEERLDDLITHIRNKLDDLSMHDKKAYIDRMKSEFKEKLTE